MASVAKRKWKKPDGSTGEKWVMRYVDPGGAHRQKTFERKKDADRAKQEVEGLALRGLLAHSAVPTTIAALAESWIQMRERLHSEGSLARSSLERDRFQANNHVVRLLGAVRVGDLKPNHVDTFIAELRQWKTAHMGGVMAPSTVRHICRTLAAMLDYAKRRGLTATNVARDVMEWPEHRGTKKVAVRTFTVEQMRRLLLAIEEPRKWTMERSQHLSRAIIYLGAFCGMRHGEVLGLTAANIDWDRRIIRIRHNLDFWDNHKDPKSRAGIRDVPMPDQVAQALRAWEPYMVPNDRGLVFVSRKGKRLLPEPFRRDLWRPVLKTAGLAGKDANGRVFTFHALRHFFASMMVEARLPGADVARLCGHAEFDTTLRIYTHSTTDADHRYDASDALAARLLSGPAVAQDLRTAA